MSVLAKNVIEALRAHGVPELRTYEGALIAAFTEFPPPFGGREYSDLYLSSAQDPDWVALSLLTAAQSEGEGARHLWDMAASTPDTVVSGQIQEHAIDEARHSRAYVTLLGLNFPDYTAEELRVKLGGLSPGYTRRTPLSAIVGSPYAYPASVDELIQMNIAEIRTRIYHLLQRPTLLVHYCKANQRIRVRQILDRLLGDETRHIAYTALLIERAARASGNEQVFELMRARVRDFNEITEQELARRALAAA